ncbi:hypothetical protein RIVERRIDER_72 [Xanthomonas phage RiverRider]|uniref:Uncharacterized protein n=1 Tax=Xanthomonas phage RiverRider TaxID=2108116 RepID=A0A2P1JV10_9CAUD|nr:hypothetical protein HWB58_gp63 [Xanthomonas phage RiverRider]AVO23153.1 hypothetical protein RIVERRIDER_72 [Xanthomonas phage RiverRider]
MATTLQDWQSSYPALANLNFGTNSITGGTDIFSGSYGLGRPTGMADLPATNYGANGAGFVPAQGGAGVAGIGGMGAGGSGLGWNMNTLQLGLGGLQTLGGLYGAFQANKLARDQFNFSKSFANTNLNNSMQTYNTALADRARSRAVVEGQSDAERDQYVDQNRLTRS